MQRPNPTLTQRFGLIIVGVSPIIANAIGSIFNILYNQTQIAPLLSDAQMQRFEACWQWFNLIVYPLAISCYVIPLVMLWPSHRACLKVVRWLLIDCLRHERMWSICRGGF